MIIFMAVRFMKILLRIIIIFLIVLFRCCMYFFGKSFWIVIILNMSLSLRIGIFFNLRSFMMFLFQKAVILMNVFIKFNFIRLLNWICISKLFFTHSYLQALYNKYSKTKNIFFHNLNINYKYLYLKILTFLKKI